MLVGRSEAGSCTRYDFARGFGLAARCDQERNPQSGPDRPDHSSHVVAEDPNDGSIPMSNGVRQMPGHVEAAYKEVVNNIFFIKRQQWVTTNYTILVYAAIFIISARFFTRTDLARGWLGLLTFLTFFYHLYMIKLFQDAITSFRDRLAWIYRTYFSADEQAGLNLPLRPDPYWHQAAVPLGLIAVSMVGAVLTLIYLFSVR